MNKYLVGCGAALMLCGALAMSSCSSKGDTGASQEDLAQIENARNEGRNAARNFINRNFKDSLEIQQELVDAGTHRAKYDTLPRSRETFDSAFISTIRTVRPDVADVLARYKVKMKKRPQ